MYKFNKRNSNKLFKKITVFAVALILLIGVGIFSVNRYYQASLKPVDNNASKDIYFTVQSGMTPAEISQKLKDKKLIRDSKVFYQYVKTNELGEKFTAGTYKLRQSMDVPQIVSTLIEGQVATDLFTILPGSNIDQIKKNLHETEKYTSEEIDSAFDPILYKGHPAIVDLPKGASLEGFIYPDSYQFIAETKPSDIIRQALDEMALALTPTIRSGIANQGISVYEGITLASIVENEVGERGNDGKVNDNRAKAAQVFLKRLNVDMKLESNATDGYPDIYDTYSIDGLPPEPITNVTKSSLEAVANPAKTNYLFFVSGKDCITRFSETNEQHEQLIKEHGVAEASDNCR